MKNIKIFVTYKDRHKILNSDIIKPIQTGRAIAEEVFDEMLGDDTGDNISVLNENFCEATAIYWVWKHYEEIGNPEYIGFMHYRRHFLFGYKKYNPNFYGLVKFDDLNDDYLQNDLTSDENIYKTASQFDAIIPQPIDISCSKCKTNYQQYKVCHKIEDYDKMMQIINEKFPEYSSALKKYNNSKYGYFLNMYIFKKEIFFKCCEFIFGVLFELKSQISYNRDEYQNRVLGFLSERLTGVFITKLLEENLNIKTLPVSFIQNGLDVESVRNPKAIPIVIASSDEYVPYTTVFLKSLKDHTSPNNFYEINILEKDITLVHKKQIKDFIEQDNIKIKFINTKKALKPFENKCKGKHYSVETYSRIFIPNLLPEYDKCLYLDIDMLVLDDVAKLYLETNLDGHSLAMAKDPVMNYIYYSGNKNKMKKYFNEVLEMPNSDLYFQNGVGIFNLKKMRENNDIEQLCKRVEKMKVMFNDQCIYNHYYKDDVVFIDNSWNYEIEHKNMKDNNALIYLPIDLMQGYLRAKENPKIIHYAGNRKPWSFPDEEFANLWWEYARKTPFYEEIISRIYEKGALGKVLSCLLNYRLNVLRYWKYKLLSEISFGKAKKRYMFKRYLYKARIKVLKPFKKFN